MKKVFIIGGGPAGLTAAYELLKKYSDYEVTVFEENFFLGGISRTAVYRGNRMDMGGHRFFSKMPEVNDWWEKMMPIQGAPAKDDIILNRDVSLSKGGPDPETTDVVMLSRHRVSRILFNGKFYDYPISLKPETIKNLGLVNTLKCGLSYINALIHKLPENNLENFYIDSFGRQLYSMFFEYYTENLWGRHPKEIDATWGAQRTKGLSIGGILRDIVDKVFHKKDRTVNTSLIEEFYYPKLGPGQLWEITGEKIEKLGGTIIKGAKVIGFNKKGDRIDSLTYVKDGGKYTEQADFFISSMPLKDLIKGMNDVPENAERIAAGLPYRDYITLGVLVKKLKLKNKTSIKTIGDIVPDCWVYVQDRSVKLGRFQIYNNWSPYLVKDLENTVWIGLEYFCNEGDKLWNMNENAFSEFAVQEMIKIGLIENPDDILDTHLERVKKAYPAYFDTYNEIDTLIEFLNTIVNLYCVGRNGQHRYNNLDHSMMTSFKAVKCLVNGEEDKSEIWNVNTEKEYHEVRKRQ